MRYVDRDGNVTEWSWAKSSPLFVGYADNNPSGKMMDCPALIVCEGQTVGEAVCLSTCNCLFCHTIRTS
jgi:hypothetical protein